MSLIKSQLLTSEKKITALFTTKEQGNLAFHVNDNPQTVLNNHKQLSKDLNYKLDSLIYMKQIHSNRVEIITTEKNFNTPPTADAMITNLKEKVLMVMVADCTPILFYDPKKEVIAVAHAGREGAFKNIISNVIDKFTQNFNSNVKNILVSIGPSICKNCYEVQKDIYNEAKIYNLQNACEKKEEKFYLDIKYILKEQLLKKGVLQKHIENIDFCSKCTPELFSYRQNKECGRFTGIIFFRP